jgi:tetratricopeptide (TPR) repeat protein
MKIIAVLAICVFSFFGEAIAQQQHQTEVLKNLIQKSGTDTSKALYYIELSKLYYLERPDSGAIFANHAQVISEQLNFKRGQMYALTQAGFSLWLLGDPASALEAFLESNTIARELNDNWAIARNYDGMACANLEQGEIDDAIAYANKSVALFTKLKDYANVVNVLTDVSLGYQSLGKLNLALKHAQWAYNLSIRINSKNWQPLTLGNLGRVYSKLNKDTLALQYLRKALLADRHPKAWILSGNYNTIAGVFSKLGRRDSSMYYYKKGFDVASRASIVQNALVSSTMLARIYQGNNNAEAVRYYNSALAYKDSLSNTEKTKKFVLITITDKRHQEELAEAKKHVEFVHSQNLQLLAIAVFIPFFLIVVLLLSRTKTHRRIIEFMSVLALLFVFEFITLLIHPLVGRITDHTPVLELLILVALAAVLVPLHHWLTHWLRHKLVNAHLMEDHDKANHKKHADEADKAETT